MVGDVRPDHHHDHARGRDGDRPRAVHHARHPRRRIEGLTVSRIVAVDVLDVRFPTSRSLDGSDAMNPDPDYSAAYVIVRTDADDGLEGHGFTFTIGRAHRGRGRRCAPTARRGPLDGRAVRRHGRVLAPAGRRQPAALDRPGEGRDAPRDGRGRERRLGPVREDRRQAALEAGRRHDARKIVALVDFRYISDARRRNARSNDCGARPQPRATRGRASAGGLPAYTTSVGWLGYDDDKIRRLCREALAEGWTRFKLKVERISPMTADARASSARRSAPTR